MLKDLINKIPLGYSEGHYNASKYGITKTEFNGGKSSKIYAKELKGNDFISLNFYSTKNGDKLKPCEMPDHKVLDFLRKVELIKKNNQTPNQSSLD